MIMATVLFLMRHSVVLFGLVFLVLMATTFWPGRRAGYDRDAGIPLRDDN